MGIIHIMKRGGDDYREYKKALKTLKEAKEAIEIICELTDDMEEEYGSGVKSRGYARDDWDDSEERVSYRGYRRMR